MKWRSVHTISLNLGSRNVMSFVDDFHLSRWIVYFKCRALTNCSIHLADLVNAQHIKINNLTTQMETFSNWHNITWPNVECTREFHHFTEKKTWRCNPTHLKIGPLTLCLKILHIKTAYRKAKGKAWRLLSQLYRLKMLLLLGRISLIEGNRELKKWWWCQRHASALREEKTHVACLLQIN